MNDELLQLYEVEYGRYVKEFKDYCITNGKIIDPADPLLISLDEEEFKKANIRVMVFGQETNGWYEKSGHYSIRYIRSGYEHFSKKKKGKHFFNGSNYFIKLLKSKFPDKNIQYVWNNIVKIGKSDSKGFPGNELYNIERLYFNIAKQEIEIIKPDIILFLTGPKYDRCIRDKFGEINFEKVGEFSTQQLAKLNIENAKYSFRTYHPNFLYRNKIDHYYNEIIENISL